MASEETTTNKLIKRDQVEALTGLTKSTLYKMVKAGEFPAPVNISQRSVAWRDNDIAAWINSRQSSRK